LVKFVPGSCVTQYVALYFDPADLVAPP